MSIKITYSDAASGKVLAGLTVEDAELKALSIDMVSSVPEVVFLNWYTNAIQNKIRQCIDAVCEEALNDQTHTILTIAEKRQLRNALDAKGVVITSIKQLPPNIKRQIVAAARIKSAAERQAEEESVIS